MKFDTKAPVLTVLAVGLLTVIVVGGGTAAVLHQSTGERLDSDTTAGTATQSEQEAVMGTQVAAETPTRYEQTSIAPEAGTYLAGRMAKLEAIHENNVIEEKLDRASNGSSRRAELLDGAARIGNDVERLRSYHRETYRSFRAGLIDEETFTLRLLFVHMAAKGYETPVEELAVADDRVSDASILEEQRALEGDVLAMQGAVRSDLVQSMRTDEKSGSIYTMAHENGTVLISLSEESFVREAYRDDRRTRGGSPTDRTSEYLREAEELYPWITQVDALDNVRGGPEGDMVSVDLVASRDDVVSIYMNAVNKDVVREDKRLDTEEIPAAQPLTRSDGEMKVTINRTYATGPMKVTLVDAETNKPLDGTIRVDGQTVGQTGADGTVWTVDPPGQTRVEATLGSRSLTVQFNDR